MPTVKTRLVAERGLWLPDDAVYASPVAGDVAYNGAEVVIYDGATWQVVGPAGSHNHNAFYASIDHDHQNEAGNYKVLTRLTTRQAGDENLTGTSKANFDSTIYTIPASELALGDVLRITGGGFYSTAGTGPTIILTLDFGGVSFASIETTLGANRANAPWSFLLLLLIDSSDGVTRPSGFATFGVTAAGGGSEHSGWLTSQTTPTLSATIATDFNMQFSTANASNIITLSNYLMERIRYA